MTIKLLSWDVVYIFGSTVKPHYNENLGAMKITLLFQVLCYMYIGVKTKQKDGTSKITLLKEGLVINIQPLYNEVPLCQIIQCSHLINIQTHDYVV